MEKEESGWAPVLVETDLPPAPPELLKNVRCNCTTNCTSKNCGCSKHRLYCSIAFGNCRGSGCENAGPITTFDDDSDTDEEDP